MSLSIWLLFWEVAGRVVENTSNYQDLKRSKRQSCLRHCGSIPHWDLPHYIYGGFDSNVHVLMIKLRLGYNTVTTHHYINTYLWGPHRWWWLTRLEKARLLRNLWFQPFSSSAFEAMARSKRFVDELVWKLKAFGAPKDTSHALISFCV